MVSCPLHLERFNLSSIQKTLTPEQTAHLFAASYHWNVREEGFYLTLGTKYGSDAAMLSNALSQETRYLETALKEAVVTRGRQAGLPAGTQITANFCRLVYDRAYRGSVLVADGVNAERVSAWLSSELSIIDEKYASKRAIARAGKPVRTSKFGV